jgi:hypothetical protein
MPTECSCGKACPPFGLYYVSVQNDLHPARGRQTQLLAGPFDTHDEALGHVPMARQLAEQLDPKAAWYAFGTVKVETKNAPTVGILNQRLHLGPTLTVFRDCQLVVARLPHQHVRAGEKGCIIARGAVAAYYHRVYWPARRIATWHPGTALDLLPLQPEMW